MLYSCINISLHWITLQCVLIPLSSGVSCPLLFPPGWLAMAYTTVLQKAWWGTKRRWPLPTTSMRTTTPWLGLHWHPAWPCALWSGSWGGEEDSCSSWYLQLWHHFCSWAFSTVSWRQELFRTMPAWHANKGKGNTSISFAFPRFVMSYTCTVLASEFVSRFPQTLVSQAH